MWTGISPTLKLRFWFRILGTRPTNVRLQSLQVFVEYGQAGEAWPSNDALNISSGSIYGEVMGERMPNLLSVHTSSTTLRGVESHGRDGRPARSRITPIAVAAARDLGHEDVGRWEKNPTLARV